MRLSTLVELLGFACLSAASFIWQSVRLEVVSGLVVTGLLLLLVGYATDDDAAVIAVSRMVAPLKARRARRRIRRDTRKASAAA